MIRLLRDTLDVRIRRMLGRSAERPSRKVERALRPGCMDCKAAGVPTVRGGNCCAFRHEARRQAWIRHRRSRGVPARVGCPCVVAGHYPVNCPKGATSEGTTT